MKLYSLFFLLLFLPMQKYGTHTSKETLQIPETDDQLSGQLFEFTPTNDPFFCNQDSIIEGDCFTGFLYFTSKGHVIYREDCVNDIAASYYIGTYRVSTGDINCQFSKVYTFKTDWDESYPDKGKMADTDTFSLQLEKASCKGKYGIREASEQGGYYYSLVQSADKESSEFFMNEFHQINKLKSY